MLSRKKKSFLPVAVGAFNHPLDDPSGMAIDSHAGEMARACTDEHQTMVTRALFDQFLQKKIAIVIYIRCRYTSTKKKQDVSASYGGSVTSSRRSLFTHGQLDGGRQCFAYIRIDIPQMSAALDFAAQELGAQRIDIRYRYGVMWRDKMRDGRDGFDGLCRWRQDIEWPFADGNIT